MRIVLVKIGKGKKKSKVQNIPTLFFKSKRKYEIKIGNIFKRDYFSI